MKFQEPPPGKAGGRKSVIDAEVAELKKHPGKWALVAEDVNSNRATAYITRGCEVTRRSTNYERQRSDIYARWPA